MACELMQRQFVRIGIPYRYCTDADFLNRVNVGEEGVVFLRGPGVSEGDAPSAIFTFQY